MQEQIKELINAISNNDTIKSLSTFNDIVNEKVALSIDNYKERVAASMFSESNSSKEE